MLGHGKLSFVDHALGRQPMISCSQRSAIVFNGEIYSHTKLRRRLIAEGMEFRTGSAHPLSFRHSIGYVLEGFAADKRRRPIIVVDDRVDRSDEEHASLAR